MKNWTILSISESKTALALILPIPMTTFLAQLWKRTEDYEGEITLVFKVPLTCADDAKQIPTQESLKIVVSLENNDQ